MVKSRVIIGFHDDLNRKIRLKHSYAIHKTCFSAEYCERIIEQAETAGLTKGAVRLEPQRKSRSSEVAWLNNTDDRHWLFKPLRDLAESMNDELWRWNITDVESLQYTRYNENQFCSWHIDARPEPYPSGKR